MGQARRWRCRRCLIERSHAYKVDFYKIECREPVPAGHTAGSWAKARKKKKALQEEWEKRKPGGHLLTWDGDTQGVLVCSRCTRKWLYASGAIWRVQIQQTCAGSAEEEDKKREVFRETLVTWQAGQVDGPTTHKLFFDGAKDLVSCSRCRRGAAARLWRANFAHACPGEGGKSEKERKRELKRGKAKTAALKGKSDVGLFGVGKGTRDAAAASKAGQKKGQKPISRSASRQAAAASPGGPRPPGLAEERRTQETMQKQGLAVPDLHQGQRGPADPRKPRGRSAPSAPD